MARGKDKKQRVRRKSTPKETEARRKRKEEEKRRQASRAVAESRANRHSFFSAAAGNAPGPNGTTVADKPTAVQDAANHQIDDHQPVLPQSPTLPPTVEEIDVPEDDEDVPELEGICLPVDESFEEIDVPDQNGIVDGLLDVDMEDIDHVDGNESHKNGVMGVFLKHVQACLAKESSTANLVHDTWLLQHLKRNGWWIRREQAPFICKKLGITLFNEHYYRDVRLWIPEKEGGRVAMPSCVSCKRNNDVKFNCWPVHPARRVISFSTHYFLMGAQYKCDACKTLRRQNPEQRRQWTFMPWHEECLKLIPGELKYKFPAVLSAKAGVDKNVMRMLRASMDKGLRPLAFSEILRELHSLEYTELHIMHEYGVSRDKQSRLVAPKEMFSSFGDRREYDGSVPSGDYLVNLHKKEHAKRRYHLDLEVKKIRSERLRIDGSCKAPKKLGRWNGQQLHSVLQTAKNEIGQTRIQALATSDCHEQLEPSLDAMNETDRDYGRPDSIKLCQTDNPARDNQFLQEKLPGVAETQKRLDTIAAMRNQVMAGLSYPESQQDLPMVDGTRDQGGGLDVDDFQVVAWAQISTKITALAQEIAHTESRLTFALDVEYDTVASHNGLRKSGKVAVLQIGYKIGQDRVKAMVMQLNRKKDSRLPLPLVNFLTNPGAQFVGVNVKQDVCLLADDFGCPSLRLDTNVVELGMFARRRDIVQNGNVSLQQVVEKVTGFRMSKDETVRCSQWSKANLSAKQTEYAALDVIKPLEAFFVMEQKPDLCQRLDPSLASTGLIVDIVPGLSRTTCRPTTGNHCVGDLATRGAIGKITGDKTIVYKQDLNLRKRRVKINLDKQRIVEVTEILAPMLSIPGHKIDGRKVVLNDFTTAPFAPFKIVLPLTMLKEHVSSGEVRTFGERPPTAARITRPSAGVRIDDIPAFEDEDINNDIQDDSDETMELGVDENATESALNSVQESALLAEVTDVQRRNDLMRCSHLHEPPETVEVRYSAVLGDAFHAIDRPKIPTKHEYKKSYKYAFMSAMLAWDKEKLTKVQSKLKSNGGWTDEQIEATMYFRPRFFQQRVERIALDPSFLYWRVRAVFVTFGNKIDSETGVPLFNKRAWQKADSILKEILRGFYSDPPGFDFYYFELDTKGEPKVDSYGINLLLCNRGTNDVESEHRQYSTTFRFVTGIELGDCLLSERRHRSNHRKAESRLVGYPRVGHYDTWKIDLLQNLIQRNHGYLAFPGWVNASDNCDTSESFVTVALHSKELHDKLVLRSNSISPVIKGKYSSDIKFVCKAQGVGCPFLPMYSIEERTLFRKLVLKIGVFDEHALSIKWLDYIDGVSVFPKLPAHLRTYHKTWLRNERIRVSVEGMRPDIEVLNDINRSFVPSDLQLDEAQNNDDATFNGNHNAEQSSTHQFHAMPLEAIIQHPRATFAPLMQPTGVTGLRPSDVLGPYFVGNELVYDPYFSIGAASANVRKRRSVGERGADRKRRQKRHCKRCRDYNGSNADTCIGRTKKGPNGCKYFNADGTPKEQSS